MLGRYLLQTREGTLTVDDDAAVSRAVARDLRRRYGSKYRIIRAVKHNECRHSTDHIIHSDHCLSWCRH